MTDVRFSIESKAGTIQLASTPGDMSSPFRLMAGTEGLGLPAEIVSIVPNPAGGGTFRSSRVGVRDAVLVIDIHGATRRDVATRMRELGKILEAHSAPTLIADIPQDGRFRLPFVRVGGGQEGYDEGGDGIVTWHIDIQAASPYWRGDAAVEFAVRQQDIEPVGLLPDLAELPVMASDAVGQLTVTNPGDVPAPVSWRIVGPGGPAIVELGGRGFALTEPLADGEVITITHTITGWSVLDQDGQNAYPRLAPAPKFPTVPVGTSVGVAQLSAAGAGSGIHGYFNPLRKVVH